MKPDATARQAIDLDAIAAETRAEAERTDLDHFYQADDGPALAEVMGDLLAPQALGFESTGDELKDARGLKMMRHAVVNTVRVARVSAGGANWVQPPVFERTESGYRASWQVERAA
jgi:hypothetical protein